MRAGHDVPGEGEHKIMEFIRLAKRSPGYQVRGLPALLWMLQQCLGIACCSHDHPQLCKNLYTALRCTPNPA